MKITRAFTLLEILIVVVIIGVLATLAIPKFMKTIEAAKGREAVLTMQTIRAAERMYRLDKGYASGLVNFGGNFDQLVPPYLPGNPNGNPNRNWNYRYIPAGTGRISAQRLGGSYISSIIELWINGDLGGSWPWPPTGGGGGP